MKINKILTKIPGIVIFTVLIFFMLGLANCSKKDDPVLDNGIPIANAGPDQKVTIGETVTLNGVDSKDPEGETLTYQWSLVSKPSSSNAAITGTTAVQATFELDKAGVYTIELTISDGEKTATDQIIITNKTPIINNIDLSGTEFPAFTDGLTARRDGRIYITGALFSKDFADMTVTLNDQVCTITFAKEDELEVDMPEDATSGELVVTVGEESVIFSQTIFVYTTPIHTFGELPVFDNIEDGNSFLFFEFGCIIKPKKNGKILGFRNNYSGTKKFTLWDFTTKTVLADAEYNGSIHKLSTPIAVEAGKEYMITVNSNNWKAYKNTAGTNIFPSMIHEVIEITGYGNVIGTNQTFPTNIVRDQNWFAGLADVYFVPDL